MCNFKSGIVTKKEVFTLLETDSHSDILEHYKIKDVETPPNFVKVELIPKNNLYEDVYHLDLKHWQLKVDQDSTPVWWKGSEKWVENEMLKALKDTVKKRFVLSGQDIPEIKEGKNWYILGGTVNDISGGTVNYIRGGTVNYISGGTVNDISGGTVNYIRGGTVNDIWGGTVNYIRGGTVNYISGGTVNYISGGTVNYISGGTVNYISGGTVNYIRGGTVNNISGGTVNYIRGGTVNDIRGGTVNNISDEAIVISRCNGVLTIKTGSKYHTIKHEVQK